ncbi:MAG: DEAD/DEAH box helicase [Proteobacteria bacterium]|nr:DEAD/DEAH box helicase [Pseudomonadota bacterium]
MSSCMYAAAISWADRSAVWDAASQVYEDQGGIESPRQNDVRPLIRHIASEVLPGFDIDLLERQDSKFERFCEVVTRYLTKHPSEKIIVFAYFKPTLNYLNDRLSSVGITCQTLHGDIADNKQYAIHRFRDSRGTRVLLTSEVASEGVDLQFCSFVVNYDLPWNPMKIEQRIGRIDRIGQRAERVLIWNMGYANTIDERIYTRLLEKLNIFERALGGMEVVLGARIRELAGELLSLELTPEQEEERIEQAYLAAENVKRQQDELEANAAHLIAHGGYILERVQAAHDFKRRITDHDLKAYVKDYLDRYVTGFEFHENDRNPLSVNIRLPARLVTRLQDFVRRARLYGQTRLATGDSVVCRFANNVDRRVQDAEIVSQFHPLVRFISHDLRERSEGYYPLVAVTVSRSAASHLQTGDFAFAVKRWTFSGLRTDEQLQARAMPLNKGPDLLDADKSWDLVNAAKVSGADWLSAGNDMAVDRLEAAFDICDVQLLDDYEFAKRDRKNENSDRVSLQLITATRHRDRLLSTQRRLLARYRLEERHPLVRMTDGRIRAIERRFELQLERLRQKGSMASSEANVCYGVVKVTN